MAAEIVSLVGAPFRETLPAFVLRCGTVTADAVARRFGIEPADAARRLDHLADAGIIRRGPVVAFTIEGGGGRCRTWEAVTE